MSGRRDRHGHMSRLDRRDFRPVWTGRAAGPLDPGGDDDRETGREDDDDVADGMNTGSASRSTRQGRVCPGCGSIAIARILYGYPGFGPEVQAEVDAGRAVLGGCLVWPGQAQRRCRSCGLRFQADGSPEQLPECGR